jgi:transposase
MNIIGCDLHTRYQVVAWIDEETGEIRTRRLEHGKDEVRAFYAGWPRGACVGIEATLPALWFERLLGECGHELWVGDAARIRAQAVRQQKTDTHDAEHLLDLLRTHRFPRIWVPTAEERDLRQLLVHRMKLVRMRTLMKNQLHALAMSQGVCRKRKLWTAKGRAELEGLALLPWARRRRKELLELLDRLKAVIEPLDQAVEVEAKARRGGGASDDASRGRASDISSLRSHPGTGGAICQQPQAGELPGTEPQRALQWRPSEARPHQ